MDNQQYVTAEELKELGITLNESDANLLIDHINNTVEERVGVEITDSLTDEQISELADLQETATDEQLGEWIASHVPDYVQIVQDNVDIVIGEIAQEHKAINS